ncbi:MAG: hypothetical protein MRY83_07130 [Flavobacteriales bacterium]|nr:hypothetical protein [Flavobacteriales bacterium]
MKTITTIKLITLLMIAQVTFGQEKETKEYFENGKVKVEGLENNGLKTGPWKYYFENGNIQRLENYSEDGVPEGNWIWYNEKGEFDKKVEMNGVGDGYTNIQMGKMKISINDDGELDADSLEADTSESKRDNNSFLFDVGTKGYFFNNKFEVNGASGQELYDIDIANSESFGLYSMYAIPNKRLVNLEIGWGFEFNSYQFENNVVMRDSLNVTQVTLDTVREFSKNSFKTTYAKLPIMLSFTTKNEDFKLSLGGMVGAKIGSRLKRKYNSGDDAIKEIAKNDFNVSPFTATGVVRAYYKWIGVFGTYDLTPLFKSGSNAVEVNPFSVGVSFDF